MSRILCTIILAAAVSGSAELMADVADFSCVEAYRDANQAYFAKSSDVLSSAREREDAHRIWEIYHAIEMRNYGPYATEDVSGMLHVLNTKPERELGVLTEFVRILESGEACEDGKPAKSWSEILNALRPLAY